MTSLATLKREIALVQKAIATDKDTEQKQQSEQIQKLNFYTEKIIELSRHPDAEALTALNLEIEAFNAAHPATAEDLIRLEPYRQTIETVAERSLNTVNSQSLNGCEG